MNDVAAIRERSQSFGEEVANCVSHGLAALAAIAVAPVLIAAAAERGDNAVTIATAVFSAAMVLLYMTSAVYHAVPQNRAKELLQVADHIAIFLLIAGTYTPFTMGVLYGTLGWTLFALIWTLAAVGIFLKITRGVNDSLASTVLYLAMGWLGLVAVRSLWLQLNGWGLFWLAAGGISYSVGVAFFLTDHRVRYGHFIWHLFVIGGTACHCVAVLHHSA